MPKAASRILCLLAALGVSLAAAPAALAVDTPFSTRFAQTVRGDIRAVGNVLLTCPAAAANCTNAQAGTGSPLTNNSYTMGNVDVDSDAATFNSSAATVSLPAGSTVVWAGLYWGADTSAGTNGAPAPTPASQDSVRFDAGSGYQTISASAADVLTSTSWPTRYRAFRDVTGLLPAAGNGTYTVANVQAGTGQDRFAGWALIVAYRDDTQAIRRLNVFDGVGTVDATNNNFSTNIGPFFTPSSGPVTTTVGLVGYEGDAGLASEGMTFAGTGFSDTLNPANDVFNSTISSNDAHFTAKNPNYVNQMGIDIDSYTRTGLLTNNQSSAVLALSSTQDYFMASALYLVTDEGPAVNTSGPTIGGVARDGATLTADPGAWQGTPTITYGYQWQRCDVNGLNCVNIGGATGTTYDLTPADVGSTIRVVVIANNDAGASNPATSNQTATVQQDPPANSTPPQVNGSTQDGDTLGVTLGAWTGTDPLAYTYQWERCDAAGSNCVDISGATAATYDLTGVDVGHTIRVEVTATNDAGQATSTSAPSTLTVAEPPANTGTPTIAGVPTSGEILTADPGTWTGTDPIDFDYQWQLCDSDGSNCVDIGGATEQTYELVPGDIGHVVRVVVTANNGTGPVTANSATTAILAPPVAEPAGPPELSGTTVEGQTLTADPGEWSGDDPIVLTYQWQSCDANGANCVDIAGATDDTYVLTDEDVGHTIVVVVTGNNGAGGDQASSAPSAVVAAAPDPDPSDGGAGTQDPPATSPQPAAPATDAQGDDLGAVPGNLLADTSCQQLAGNAKYRRIKLKGIGTVRLRAYTSGPAMKVTPMRVSTQVTGGRARSVRYQLDGKALKAKKAPRYMATITPAQLKRIGTHTLKAMVKGKKGKPKPVVLALKTVPCRTLFTAQRWKTTAGAGLRLRVDARTALQRIAFKVPAGLLPKQTTKRRRVGFVRFFIAGSRRQRFELVLPRKGTKPALLSGSGKPAITYAAGGLQVAGVPARAAVAELTLYRVTKLDKATQRRVYKLRARVLRAASPQESFSARPAAPR